MGTERVIMTDLVDERLKFARNLGADETINAGEENVKEAVRRATGGYGADVVIELLDNQYADKH